LSKNISNDKNDIISILRVHNVWLLGCLTPSLAIADWIWYSPGE